MDLHKPNNELVSSWLEHFGARMSHGQTRIHKTHHDPNLEEATTFPLIIYFVFGNGTNTQMSFCLETPKSRSSQSWDSCDFGGPQLFVHTSNWDEVESKVVAFIERFPMVCGTPLEHKESGRFLTFSGWESNCQFDFRPFFWPQLVFEMSKWVMRAHFRHLRSKKFLMI
jgi:hypothetical protein